MKIVSVLSTRYLRFTKLESSQVEEPMMPVWMSARNVWSVSVELHVKACKGDDESAFTTVCQSVVFLKAFGGGERDGRQATVHF